MKNNELQAYLKKFNRDKDIVVIVVDVEGRNHYSIRGIMCATDMGDPVIILDVGTPENLDCANLEHTDLSDQMVLDFTEKGIGE